MNPPAHPGPVARVIHAAIIRHDSPRAELREIVQEAGQLEVPKLERFLGVLATLAYLAPLLGLLGTVAGMIDAFGTDLFQWRLRDCDGTFDRRLQEPAHHRGRTGRGDSDFCRLQLSFIAGEHPDARNGTRRDRSRAHADRSRADRRHHQLSAAAGEERGCAPNAEGRAFDAYSRLTTNEAHPDEGISLRLALCLSAARRRLSPHLFLSSQLEFYSPAGHLGFGSVLPLHPRPAAESSRSSASPAARTRRFIFAIRKSRSSNSARS